MRSVIIDTNIFLLLIVGLIDSSKIHKHRRTSLYSKEHFETLVRVVDNYDQILTCPNIFTEVDNLLNGYTGNDRLKYFQIFNKIVSNSMEKYLQSRDAIQHQFFQSVGLTDSVILAMAQGADLLISGDSKLCDHARSLGIELFDFKAYVNEEIMAGPYLK